MVIFKKLRKSPGRRSTDMSHPWRWIIVAILAGIGMMFCAQRAMAIEIDFVVPAHMYDASGHSVVIPSDDDLLPICEMENAFEMARGIYPGTTEEIVIVRVCVEYHIIASFFTELDGRLLDKNTAAECHIGNSYVGHGTMKEVYGKFPLWAGSYFVVEDEGEREVFYITEKHISGCRE